MATATSPRIHTPASADAPCTAARHPYCCYCRPQDFDLTLDIDRLIKEVDTNGSGVIEYREFAAILA